MTSKSFPPAVYGMSLILCYLCLSVFLSCSPKKEVQQSMENDTIMETSDNNNSQETDSETSAFGSREELCNCWKHDRESEDSSGAYKIFRPCDSKEWPRSRFRQSYEFRPDGSCEYRFLAPNDGHYNKEASFIYYRDKGQIIMKNDKGKEVGQLNLLLLTKDEMHIQK